MFSGFTLVGKQQRGICRANNSSKHILLHHLVGLLELQNQLTLCLWCYLPMAMSCNSSQRAVVSLWLCQIKSVLEPLTNEYTSKTDPFLWWSWWNRTLLWSEMELICQYTVMVNIFLQEIIKAIEKEYLHFKTWLALKSERNASNIPVTWAQEFGLSFLHFSI